MSRGDFSAFMDFEGQPIFLSVSQTAIKSASVPKWLIHLKRKLSLDVASDIRTKKADERNVILTVSSTKQEELFVFIVSPWELFEQNVTLAQKSGALGSSAKCVCLLPSMSSIVFEA